MKILHLADLHLGRKINDFSLINDQKFVLNQALELILKNNIQSVLISGDVFDRAIPSADALELFGDFLSKLSKYFVKTFIIAGNHDNVERLSYLSDLIRSSDIYISKVFSGEIERFSINNDIDVYLMPYLYPAEIRKYYPDIKVGDYNGAIKAVVDDVKIKKDKINILLAHQFVFFLDVIFSESEQLGVGGIEGVSPKIFDKFDYVALGHLHCPQRVLTDKIRYGGSILKYSFSEINQKKVFTVLDVKNKNEILFEFHEIEFLHDLKVYRGYIDEFLRKDFYKNVKRDDYIHFVLLDEYVLDARKKLSAIYPNIMFLEFDNQFTRNINSVSKTFKGNDKSLVEHFFDFYKVQCNENIDEVKKEIVYNLLEDLKEIE